MLCNGCMEKEEWCRSRDLNSGPTDYESVALPLSYFGLCPAGGRPVGAEAGRTIRKTAPAAQGHVAMIRASKA